MIDPGLETVHGIEPFLAYLETFKRAMPDARVEISSVCEAGNIVPSRAASSAPTPVHSGLPTETSAERAQP